MKIAVTYEDGQIFQHFGHTGTFKVYEIRDGRVVSTLVTETGGQGHEALAGFLARCGAEALICGGIGPGAAEALKEAGIALYPGLTGNADQAVEAFLAGNLTPSEEGTCDSHDHAEGGSCCPHDPALEGLTDPHADPCCDGIPGEACGGCEGCGQAAVLTRESLEGGEILRFLIRQFMEQPGQETYIPVLRCLRDSRVWMVGETDEDGYFIPDTAENGRAVFLPVFSAADQAEVEEGEDLLEVHFLDALARAMGSAELQGIVVDPFTGPCVVDRDIYGIFEEIPSVLEEDEA